MEYVICINLVNIQTMQAAFSYISTGTCSAFLQQIPHVESATSQSGAFSPKNDNGFRIVLESIRSGNCDLLVDETVVNWVSKQAKQSPLFHRFNADSSISFWDCLQTSLDCSVSGGTSAMAGDPSIAGLVLDSPFSDLKAAPVEGWAIEPWEPQRVVAEPS